MINMINKMADSYKVYSLEVPTAVEDAPQKLLLIENGGEYGFATCPSHTGTPTGAYWYINNPVYLEEMKKSVFRQNIQPTVISGEKEKSLVTKLISVVNSNKNILFLGREENEVISQILELIPK